MEVDGHDRIWCGGSWDLLELEEENDLPHIVVFHVSHIYRHLHKIYMDTNPNHNGQISSTNMAGYKPNMLGICMAYSVCLTGSHTDLRW